MKKFPFILNKAYHEWPERLISEAELRKLGNLKNDVSLFWKVQGGDEEITAANPVDLGRDGIEQIYSVHAEKYQFIVNDKLFVSHEPFITGAEIRAVGEIPPGDKVYFRLEGEDSEVPPDKKIDLKPFPIETFYSKSKLVKIEIKSKPYFVEPGVYNVSKLKEIGAVPVSHTLLQVINNDPVPLNDDGQVEICGGEIFISNPKTGTSS